MNDPQTPTDADTSWRCTSTNPTGGAQCALPVGHKGRDVTNNWDLHQDQSQRHWAEEGDACTSLAVLSGPADCLDGDCDEYATEDGEPTGIEHCSHVRTEQVCATHSEFSDDEWEYCTKAVPWPHLTATAPSTVEA